MLPWLVVMYEWVLDSDRKSEINWIVVWIGGICQVQLHGSQEMFEMIPRGSSDKNESDVIITNLWRSTSCKKKKPDQQPTFDILVVKEHLPYDRPAITNKNAQSSSYSGFERVWRRKSWVQLCSNRIILCGATQRRHPSVPVVRTSLTILFIVP